MLQNAISCIWYRVHICAHMCSQFENLCEKLNFNLENVKFFNEKTKMENRRIEDCRIKFAKKNNIFKFVITK